MFSCLYYRQEEVSVFFIFLCTCLLVLYFCSFYFSVDLFLGFFFWSCEGKLYKGGRCNKRYARCNPNSERYACVVWIWFDRNSRNGAKRFIHGDCKKFPFFLSPYFFFPGMGRVASSKRDAFTGVIARSVTRARLSCAAFVALRENFFRTGMSIFIFGPLTYRKFACNAAGNATSECKKVFASVVRSFVQINLLEGFTFGEN